MMRAQEGCKALLGKAFPTTASSGVQSMLVHVGARFAEQVKFVFDDDVRSAYKSFVEAASAIPGFRVGQKNDVDYDIGRLADAYCDACDSGDEFAKSAYASALMVRYWHMVPYLYRKYGWLPSSTIYDAVGWVWDGIARACAYRGWRDPSKQVHGSPRAAEKCINQCIMTVVLMACRSANRAMRRYDLSSLPYSDSYEVADGEAEAHGGDCDYLIWSVSRRSVFDAMVMAAMAYPHGRRKGVPTVRSLSSSLRKMASDSDSVSRFSAAYSVPMPKARAEAACIRSLDSSSLSKAISAARERLYEDDEVYGCLCC